MEIKNYNTYSSYISYRRYINYKKRNLFFSNFRKLSNKKIINISNYNYYNTPKESIFSIIRGSNLAKTLLLTELFKGL
jgi:hypothetical protein